MRELEILSTRWREAASSASTLRPLEEWRQRLAEAVREASSALFAATMTFPPSLWPQMRCNSSPARFDKVMERIARDYVPRIDSVREGWRWAFERHGIVYAPLEAAVSEGSVRLAEEMYEVLLSPEEIVGYVCAWVRNAQGGVMGLIVVGARDDSSRLIARIREPLEIVANLASKTLSGAIEAACELGAIIPQSSSAGALTPREAQIALLVARGDSDAKISRHFGLSEHTVGSHLRKVFAKLGVHSRVELACAMLTSRLRD